VFQRDEVGALELHWLTWQQGCDQYILLCKMAPTARQCLRPIGVVAKCRYGTTLIHIQTKLSQQPYCNHEPLF
jgi:hypothetical protein